MNYLANPKPSPRLFSALSGTLVVGLPWFLRRELGRAGTIAAAAALCISPTMLYYSRFGREDAQMVFLTLLAMILGLAYLRRPRTLTAASLAFVLACSFAIKESTYLFGLLLAIYLLIVLAAQFDAQHRVATGLSTDESLNAAFMSASLLLAAVGLVAVVVVGAASDELFVLIGLYMAALVGFVLVSALPRLRQAELDLTPPKLCLLAASLGAMALVFRAASADPAPYEFSTAAMAIGAVLAVAALALVLLPTIGGVPHATTWAAAAAIAAARAIRTRNSRRSEYHRTNQRVGCLSSDGARRGRAVDRRRSRAPRAIVQPYVAAQSTHPGRDDRRIGRHHRWSRRDGQRVSARQP